MEICKKEKEGPPMIYEEKKGGRRGAAGSSNDPGGSGALTRLINDLVFDGFSLIVREICGVIFLLFSQAPMTANPRVLFFSTPEAEVMTTSSASLDPLGTRTGIPDV
ncbi:uncharacterized protein FOMMEDRAFT_152315 [Fomitiporia mediterranea MF3/22]|uniref:uncharacterized protein n=1 Tax=Fomitiporia mediterranea (strain MF3/22) TaxID=694068 RepID=UPI0004409A57|nr:uncharacterized protein FOMMEDRAFT_152315 [Fomitiporia mediterranea MF3/22]EJD06977.1 hypothetical protein FOMMEDRAFT_152315 [Fomitiporia mediterranea MF3/22]